MADDGLSAAAKRLERDRGSDTDTDPETQPTEESAETTEEPQVDESEPVRCQAETHKGEQCSNNAKRGEYCQKHAPNDHGELTWRFKRKQWHIDRNLLDDIFETHSYSPKEIREDDGDLEWSLYERVSFEVDGQLPKQSFENSAAEFLLEYEDEFIEFMDEKYNTD